MKKVEFSRKIREKGFSKVYERWLDDLCPKIKRTTYDKYSHIAQKYVLPYFRDMPVNKIDNNIIHKFIINTTITQKNLSSGYLRNIFYVIKSVVKHYYSELNMQCPSINATIPSVRSVFPEILTDEEIKKVLDGAGKQISAVNIGILLGLCAGLRVGEVCGLAWNDISFDNHTIQIKRTVCRVSSEIERKTELILNDVKTNYSRRVIPLNPILEKQLLQYEKKCQSKFIIPGKKREFADPRTFQNKYHKAMNSFGIIEKKNFHSLRHTFATKCVEAGTDPKTISELLGHSTVEITLNVYVHSTMKEKEKAVNSVYKRFRDNF